MVRKILWGLVGLSTLGYVASFGAFLSAAILTGKQPHLPGSLYAYAFVVSLAVFLVSNATLASMEFVKWARSPGP